MSRDVDLLHEGRRRERGQAMFYRSLSGEAESAGDAATAERLNELLADEQHHVSRLTARLLELGERPRDQAVLPLDVPALTEWEPEARRREADEVAWYEAAIPALTDQASREVLEEILDSERHHHDQLGGKWMSASADASGPGASGPQEGEDEA